MPIKQIVTWAVVIFLAYYLIVRPSGAAHAVGNLFALLKHAGNAVASFLTI